MSPALVRSIERIVMLKGLPGLGDVPQEALEWFAASMKERVFKPGDELFAPGEDSSTSWLIVSGKVAMIRGDETIATRGAGESLGWLELFVDGDQDWGAIARETTLVLELERDVLFELFEDHLHGFELLHAALRELASSWIVLAQATEGGPRTTVISHPPHGYTLAEDADDPVDWVERMLYLRGLPVFREANVDGLGELAKGLAVRRIPAGTQIWRPGALVDPLHVLKGTVECRLDGKMIEVHGPALLGFPHALAGVPQVDTAIAASDIVALRGNIELLLDVIEDNPMMGTSILSELARRLFDLQMMPGNLDLAIQSQRKIS